MKILAILLALQLASTLALICPPGTFKQELQNVQIDLRLYVEDFYSVYSGNENQAIKFFGSGNDSFSWKGQLTTDDYIYIIAWTDRKGPEGLNAYISSTIPDKNTTLTITTTSNDDVWDVSATGRIGYQPTNSSQQSFLELNTQIALSNSNQSASKGWQPVLVKNPEERTVNGLTFTSKKIWQKSNGAQGSSSPNQDHKEYLIFRYYVGDGYGQKCQNCKPLHYCPGGTSEPQKCPQYSGALPKASSINDCQTYPTSLFQNLYKNTSQYEIKFNLTSNVNKSKQYVDYLVQCDESLNTFQDCKINNLLSNITFLNCPNSKTFLYNDSSKDSTHLATKHIYLSFQVDSQGCKEAIFKTNHKILAIYFRQDSSENFILASKDQEYHERFFVFDILSYAPNKLKFDSSFNESVSINYAPGQKSKNGLAEGDTFNFQDPLRFTVIHLTNQSDSLIVNDTYNKNNKSAPVPTFYLLDGDDNVTCYTDCQIYGGAGRDTFQLIGDANMVINDFNTTQDVLYINATLYNNISSVSQLSYQKTNSTTLKITFSSNKTITLYPVTGDITSINIAFGINCSKMCPNCTTAQQCLDCSDCGFCDSKKCLWCNATSFLEGGKCVSKCSAGNSVSTYNQTQCVSCKVSNCRSCSTSNYCSYCSDNYVMVNGVCQACAVSYYKYSDYTCAKCGLSCDYCNITHCLSCSRGYIQQPLLSNQICYKDLSSGMTQSFQRSIYVSSYSSPLFTRGALVYSNGLLDETMNYLEDLKAVKTLDYIQNQKSYTQNSFSEFLLSEGIPSTQVSILNIPLLKQSDERWRLIQYANGPHNIKQKGSLITCHAMAFQYLLTVRIDGLLSSPYSVNRGLISRKGYSNNQIIQDVLYNIAPYVYLRQEYNLSKIIEAYRLNQIVFLDVKRSRSSTHWVVMTGISSNNQTVYVNDPLYNDKEDRLDEIKSALVFQLKSQGLYKRTNVSLNVLTDNFTKSDLNYSSCYQYSKQSQTSQHYKDAKAIMATSSVDLKQFSQVKTYSPVVESTFSKNPNQATICSFNSSMISIANETFGITDGFDSQKFKEAGSQICSLAMVLETLGAKDEEYQYFFPDSIDTILKIDNAFKARKRTQKINGTAKVFNTKNHIDFLKVKQMNLFGLTNDIVEVSNSNLTPLNSSELNLITQQFRAGEHLFIFEVIDNDQLDTYYVFSLNLIQNNQIQVIDPVSGTQVWVSTSKLTGYIRFKTQRVLFAPKLKDIYEFLTGIPHQHIVLTYKQDSMKVGRLPDKRFYLTKWIWNDKFYFNEQSFQVVDTNTSQELTITPLWTIDRNLYTLNRVDVYINKEYLLETTQLVSNQTCSQKEVMANFGMDQRGQISSDGNYRSCFMNNILCGTKPDYICPVSTCISQFQNLYKSVESTLKLNNQGIATDSRYCALVKYSFLSQSSAEVQPNSYIFEELKKNRPYRAAYAMLNLKSTCLAKPRQAEELFQGLYYNKSPKITNLITLIEKSTVLSKLQSAIGTQTKFQNNTQYYISKAVLQALNITNEEPLAKLKTEEFGLWLEQKGYLRSDLTLDSALGGDIVIFKGTKDYPFGHVAIKQTRDQWYSDHLSAKECVYPYTSYQVYN